MTDTDCEALYAALDADPSDQDIRRVLADWYEEQGDMVMADGMRFLADCNMYPSREPNGWTWHHCNDDYPEFDWDSPWGVATRLYVTIRPAEPWASETGWRNYESRSKSYPTLREAEEALCAALAKAGVL